MTPRTILVCLALSGFSAFLGACSAGNSGGTPETGTGGSSSGGGVGLGGANSNGGATATGGVSANGGVTSSGGVSANGGMTSSGGVSGSGGSNSGTGGAGGSSVGPLPDLPWVNGSCTQRSGTIGFETAEFCVSLTTGSQTVARLEPKVAPGFDFAPSDRLSSRSGAGYFQLGDITLRYRSGSATTWQNVTTSSSRTAVTALAASGDVLAAANLAPALPSNLPLKVTRSWMNEGGRLVMQFDVTNTSSSPVEIGALGMPLVFDNIITNRTLDQAHAACSFSDPYIGGDAGYVQVTRLSGQSPALLVLPESGSPLEAWGPILDPPKADSKNPVAVFTDLTPRGSTFEGFYEWLVHSKAYTDNEWSKAKSWNAPSSVTLAAGESKSYGLKFVVSDTIRHIETTLTREERPVAVGIPGYVVPTDLEAKLYLNYPAAVSSLTVEPSGALTVTPQSATSGGWKAYAVAGKTWGRSRVTVTYADGTRQTIHYYVTKPAAQAVTDMGNFLTSKAWFVDASDPFGRSPSVMTYDHELSKVVTQSKQAWVCGLGDDGGATWLAGAMKQFGQPDAAQLTKYQDFVDGPIVGGLQYDSGTLQYGVKRTMFYYEPTLLPAGYYDPSIDWTYWGAWTRAHTLEVPRSYNYPHVTALFWSMYRIARNNTGYITNHTWNWYLDRAYRTAVAMTTIGTDYTKFGLMDGTVFIELLKDLQREGLTTQANDLQARMKARADVWQTEAYPFGSELAWDSTGQEEVYGWSRYFGYTSKAKVCIDAITGYMPAVPHWGYNGCARRYWDFLYGGSKTDRLERMIHHYGSSLNAIPVLTEFRDHPDDLYLLRIGYAGMMGTLTTIDQDGFPSMAFHAFPDTLSWDPITGDVGLNFFGHAYNTATYVVDHPEFGWQAFGGNLTVSGTTVRVTPLDSFKKRVYLASVGLWLTLDAGQFQTVELDTQTHAVKVTLAAADSHTPSARVRIEQPASIGGIGTYTVSGTYATERGASVVPLGSSTTTVTLNEN